MSRCRACGHPDRDALDAAIASGMNQGAIRERWGISERAQRRHRAHIVDTLAKATETVRGDALLARLEALTAETRGVLQRARGEDDERVLRAVARLEKQVELAAKILGAIQENTTTVTIDSAQIAAAVLDALTDFPDARAVVAQKFAEMSRAVH